jgi:hypothetical protein
MSQLTRAIGVIVLIAMPLVAWWLRPPQTGSSCGVVQGSISLPELPEVSGLALSRRTPGVIWAHNDSGFEPILFALDASGAVRGRVRLPVPLRDWEDVSAAPCPAGHCLYVADIGDNALSRLYVSIYRIPEPVPSDTQTASPDVFRAVYRDGRHNAEAAFVVDDQLFVITRDGSGGVYRSTSRLGSGGDLTLERIGEAGLIVVSDAEASPDGSLVVVRNGREAVVYSSGDLVRGAAIPLMRVSLEGLGEPQGEGVAIDASGMLYLASEGRPWTRGGSLVALRCVVPDASRTLPSQNREKPL